jgi:serine/threonine protein kinase
MGSDPDKPEDDNPATVFMPSRTPSAPPQPTSPPQSDAPSPGAPPETAASPPQQPSTPPPTASIPPQTTSMGAQTFEQISAAPGRVSIGDVLNGIYEVKRLIGRGGMGEVYEGANINSDERVAIKVMLPALAADPNVQAMFRKEARTLTRLSHPAVVQYRVLAQEPRLNVLYIVTEFVDGQALSDALGQLKPSASDLRGLTRRLAEGLRAAHDLGAVHRDMSPDNVLLPDGRLDHAKIIDFGIAKDLDPTKGTIVGDGFAGKLGYVAPEQFGDFGREIGPWTDVYSLALVILAVATGKNVDMGATLVEAVDKRRAGVDLSPLPDELKPVFERMLAPDPAKRARSMNEVLALLDPPAATIPPTMVAPPPSPPPIAPPPTPAKKGGSPLPLVLGGLLAVILAGAAAAYFLMPKHPAGAASSAAASNPPATASAVPGDLRHAVETALPGLSCSWLELVDSDQGGAKIKLVGVAGSPATVQGAVIDAARLSGSTLQGSDVDLNEVAPADQAVCSALDAFRSVRAPVAPDGPELRTEKRVYQIERQPNGKLASRAVITMAVRAPSQDFALLGLEPSGKITMIVPNRAAFDATRVNNNLITDLGGDAYKLQIDAFDFRGWSGLLLLTGKGPFDPALLTLPAGSRDVAWYDKVRQTAAANGWKSEMVWYKVVDNGVAAAAPAPAAVRPAATSPRPVQHRSGAGPSAAKGEENDMNSAEFGGGGGGYTPPASTGYQYRSANRQARGPMGRPNNNWRREQQQFQPRPGVPSY